MRYTRPCRICVQGGVDRGLLNLIQLRFGFRVMLLIPNRAGATDALVHFAGIDSALADVDFVLSSVVYSTMAWASLAVSVVIENVTGVSACVHMPLACFSGYVTRTAFCTGVDPVGLPAVADPAE